jgi:hypothetical protein
VHLLSVTYEPYDDVTCLDIKFELVLERLLICIIFLNDFYFKFKISYRDTLGHQLLDFVT